MRSALVVAALAVGASINNGKGLTPPRGWRSWNLFGGNVNQDLMTSIMTAMATRNLTVNGVPTSLADLGYLDVGLDDNWQACGSYPPNGWTYHDANGRPVVNTQRFPDFIQMTSYAHTLNLTAGWYHNNCICHDSCSEDICYTGDANAIISYGFDSVKLDGCGAEYDLTLWASLFAAAGKSILIENCHWGDTLPNATWCPWNFYRSSGDIQANYGSIVNNLQTTIPLAGQNLSTPGCWAYPDMLEVGVRYGSGGLSLVESRSHFNAWCIVSSPLTLSHDVRDWSLNAAMWPIIANTEALAVSAAYQGVSGTTFWQCSSTVTLGRGLAAVPSCQYFYKPLSPTTTAVLLMNHGAAAQALTLQFSTVPALPCGTTCKVRDINAHADLGSFTGSWGTTVASHDAAFLILSS